MKNIINISIDPSMPLKSKDNIISCLKDHKFDGCIEKNNMNNDIFITNKIENCDQFENENVLFQDEDSEIEISKSLKNVSNIIYISNNDIESLINFIDLANERKFNSLINDIKNDTKYVLEKVIKA
jgi:hypothetical protein